MQRFGCLFLLTMLCACSDTGSTGGGAEEPPFFQAKRFGSGPLTLAELKIDIPDEIERDMSEAQKACFLEAVERRAEEAGDPADIDPDSLVYWDGNVSKEDWQKHDRYMQRILLAQGVISWAMIDCT